MASQRFRANQAMLLLGTVVLFCCVPESYPKTVPGQGTFPLTLIHINDLHARFDETSPKSTACSESQKCIAGIARVYQTIKDLKVKYKSQNPLYLNAGDNFQGTLWYNLLRWNVTAHFIKQLPPDAMTLGNHEFDHSPEGLAPYLKELETKHIPTVVANLQLNGEPALKQSKIARSIVLNVAGTNVGVIGALYDKTHLVAQTGKVTFSDAIEAVRKEAQELKKKNVNIIVVLSHCGLDVDKQLAEQAGEHFDVIVGAHSHSLLLSKKADVPYDSQYDTIEGDYPLVVTKGNHKVLITQARSYGKYVGRLTVFFDQRGEVQSWEGHPIFMANSVKQDQGILEQLKPWRKEVERLGTQVIGRTDVFLDRESCRWCECTLGSLIADAFAANYTTPTRKGVVAIVQAGNFRNPIKKGDVTNGLAIEAAPYGSSVDMVKLNGADLWRAIDHSFTLDDEFRFNTMQVSGLKVVADLTRKPYERVQSIDVVDANGGSKKPLNKQSTYFVVAPSYLADGKDGFDMLKNGKERIKGPLDSDVLIDYIRKEKHIKADRFKEQRVIITKHTNGTCSWDLNDERFKPKIGLA